MSRSSRPASPVLPVRMLIGALAILAACTTLESPEPSPTNAPSESPPPSASATASPTQSPTAVPSPTPTPEPSFSLALPASTNPLVVSASVSPEIGQDGGTFTVTVTSAGSERIDELVLRWHAGLDQALRLAPFAPSDERIREGGLPLRQEWTRWVIGPGEQGEPEGTISVGWGPLLPGATLTIELVATRFAPGPIGFDLQLLAGNDLLTLADGAPAELRAEVP